MTISDNAKAVLYSVAGVLLLLLAWWGPVFLVWWEMSKQVDFWERSATYHSSKHEYYFDGVNTRGLIDICPDAAGELDIRFKEECDANNP